MLDQRRHPFLSRLVPFTSIRVWPVLTAWWCVALILTPERSSALFGWVNPWFVQTLAIAGMVCSFFVLVFPRQLLSWLAYLVVPGFVFFGRFDSLVTSDLLANSMGWRSRLLGGASYALIATAHVFCTSIAVLILTSRGEIRALHK